MDKQLVDREYLAGDYSIADMASYPWVAIHENLKQDLNDYPNLKRWHDHIKSQPATINAYKKGFDLKESSFATVKNRKIIQTQNTQTLAA